MTVEVLPAIAGACVAGAGRAPRIALAAIDCGERQAEGALLGPQHAPAAMRADLGEVVVPGAAKVRREQRVRTQRGVTLQGHVDQQHLALRIRRDPQPEFEPRVRVDDLERRHAGLRQDAAVRLQPLTSTQKPCPSATMKPRSRICGKSMRGE